MDGQCTNCGSALRSGLLSSNFLLSKEQLALINLSVATPLPSACNGCGNDLLSSARTSLTKEVGDIQATLKAILPHVPIISLQQPAGWSYEPGTIVTAQTVTGTGIFSDVASAFTDLFGTQSNAYNAKIREGENLCKASLRGQALELGGNAVLAVDVDYAEVGGQRAMLMVCMTGTAVRITHADDRIAVHLEKTANAYALAQRVRSLQAGLAAPSL